MGGGVNKSIDRFIAAAGHYKNAEGWAKTCGFKYITARTQKEFDAKIAEFIGESKVPVILEAFVSDNDERKAYSTIVDCNRNLSLKDKAKSIVKRIIR